MSSDGATQGRHYCAGHTRAKKMQVQARRLLCVASCSGVAGDWDKPWSQWRRLCKLHAVTGSARCQYQRQRRENRFTVLLAPLTSPPNPPPYVLTWPKPDRNPYWANTELTRTGLSVTCLPRLSTAGSAEHSFPHWAAQVASHLQTPKEPGEAETSGVLN